MNVDTGEIRPWASLTEEQRKSGKWIPLPGTDENGQPIEAKRKTMLDELFPPRSAEEMARDFNGRFEKRRDAIAALVEGENRYRQEVLGQGPLPGFPKVPKDA